jgi:cell division protein FtsB
MAHSKRRLTYKNEIYYIACIIAALVIFLFSLFGPKSYSDLHKSQLAKQEILTRVDRLEQEIREKQNTIHEINTNPEAREGLARGQNFAKPEDIILRLKKDNPPASPKK